MPKPKLLPNDQRDAFIQNKITSEMMKRSIHSVPLHVQRAEGDPATKETLLSFSSETYIEEYCGWEIGYAYVRLLHKPENMRLDRAKRGLSHLMNHQRDEFLGKLVDPQIMDKGEGNKLYFRAIPSNQDEAKQVWMDIEAGILDQTSLGFNVYALQLVRMEGEKAYYDAVDWEPMEGSTVTVQADLTVGFGRSIKTEEKNDESKTPDQEKRKMLPEEITAAQDAEKLEASRIAGIRAAQKHFPSIVTPDDAMEAIATRQTVDQFNNLILDRQVKNQKAATPADLIDAGKEMDQFSFRNAILGLIGDAKPGLEFEMSRQIEKQLGRSTRPNGIFLPPNAFGRASGITKDTSGAAGGYLVPTIQDPSIVDMPRPKTLLDQLGVTYIPNCVGNYQVATQIGSTTLEWIGEDAEATPSAATFGLKTGTMKKASANTSVSYDIRKNSTPGAELLAERDILKAAGLGKDKAAFHGLGSANQPLGIFNTPGVGATTITSFDFLKALDFQGDVLTADLYEGNLAYATDPATAILLRGKQQAANTAIYLLQNGVMADHPVKYSNQITAGYMAFGDWSQLCILDWGGIELIYDPITSAKSGAIVLIVFVTMDTIVRQLGSFSIGTGFTVAS